ncbi:MAG: helix-turn-helix domain-containing protein [Verrucomicrobiaceae bacterium]|nr:helix-turn-helix domain-containing protein [Verrucomicrobiaceae bacterium]
MPALGTKSPGEILEAKIKDKNLTQAQAADRIGITRQYLNGIINGKYPFTADLGLKLTEPLGTTPDFWNDAIREFESFADTDAGQAQQRAKDRESLVMDFELQGVRALVDHQIDSALQARHLNIEPPLHRDRIQASYVLLGFGLKGFLYGANGQAQPVATKPSLTLRRGESLTIPTHEKINVPARLRARVYGLSDSLADKFLSWNCVSVLDAPFNNQLTLGLTNNGPFEVKICHGDPCLMVGFEFLSQEPVRSA